MESQSEAHKENTAYSSAVKTLPGGLGLTDPLDMVEVHGSFGSEKVGTTLCCLTYADGIILAADSRRVAGANGRIDGDDATKVYKIHDSLFTVCCGHKSRIDRALELTKSQMWSVHGRPYGGCEEVSGWMADSVKHWRDKDLSKNDITRFTPAVGAILGGMDGDRLKLFTVGSHGYMSGEIGHKAVGHRAHLAQEHLSKELNAYASYDDLIEEKAMDIVRNALAAAERKSWPTGGPFNLLIFRKSGEIKLKTAVPPASMKGKTSEDYIWYDDAFEPES